MWEKRLILWVGSLLQSAAQKRACCHADCFLGDFLTSGCGTQAECSTWVHFQRDKRPLHEPQTRSRKANKLQLTIEWAESSQGCFSVCPCKREHESDFNLFCRVCLQITWRMFWFYRRRVGARSQTHRLVSRRCFGYLSWCYLRRFDVNLCFRLAQGYVGTTASASRPQPARRDSYVTDGCFLQRKQHLCSSKVLRACPSLTRMPLTAMSQSTGPDCSATSDYLLALIHVLDFCHSTVLRDDQSEPETGLLSRSCSVPNKSRIIKYISVCGA